MTEEIRCAFCGGLDDTIQHVDIAWPDGAHREVWLHPDCEQWMIEKIEGWIVQTGRDQWLVERMWNSGARWRWNF